MHPPTADWKSYLEFASHTDVGMRRKNNQDNFATVPATSEDVWVRRGHVFMVADGMGAHAAGELASELAAETVPHTYLKLLNEHPAQALRSSISEANTKIHNRGEADSEFHGMGTTCSALVLLPQGAIVAQVGDSRVYRLRGNRFEQLTFDHSLVWEMMHSGRIREDEVPSYIPKNVITRSLGPNPQVEADLEGPFPVGVGDTYLLCSDGLTGRVTDPELGAILMCLSPEEAVHALTEIANLRGGHDNITSIVVRIVGTAATTIEFEPLPPIIDPKKRTKISKGLIGTWIALAVFAIAILPLVFMGKFYVAIGSLLAATVSAGLLRFKFGVGAGDDNVGQMYGRGPHTSITVAPDETLCNALQTMAGELKTAAENKHWPVDWNRYQRHVEAANAATQKKNYPTVVRELCLAIRDVMHDVRQSRMKQE